MKPWKLSNNQSGSLSSIMLRTPHIYKNLDRPPPGGTKNNPGVDYAKAQCLGFVEYMITNLTILLNMIGTFCHYCHHLQNWQVALIGYIANAPTYIAETFIFFIAHNNYLPYARPLWDCLSDVVCRSRYLRYEIQVTIALMLPALNEKTIEWHSNLANSPASQPRWAFSQPLISYFCLSSMVSCLSSPPIAAMTLVGPGKKLKSCSTTPSGPTLTRSTWNARSPWLTSVPKLC